MKSPTRTKQLILAALLTLSAWSATAETIEMVAEMNPGTGGSDPWLLTPVGDLLYFVANRDYTSSIEYTAELWGYDLTTGDANMVEEFSGPACVGTNFYPLLEPLSETLDCIPVENLIDVDGTLFFTAYDSPTVSGYGKELWRVDNATGDAERVSDIVTGTDASSHPRSLILFNDGLYFVAGGVFTPEFWKYDIATDSVSEVDEAIANFTHTVMDYSLFYLWPDNYLVELDSSDETSNVAATFGAASEIVNNGTTLFYVDGLDFAWGDDVASLFTSDGVDESGTGPVSTTDIGTVINTIHLTIIDENLFLAGTWSEDGENAPRELFWSDGTKANTIHLSPAYAYIPPPTIRGSLMIDVNGTAFYVANVGDTTNGEELWTSDGTVTGTNIVADLAPGSTGGLVNPIDNLAGNGSDLWPFLASTPDGFVYFAGTVGIGAVAVGNDGADIELYRSDGDTIELVEDLFTGTFTDPRTQETKNNSSHPLYLTTVGDDIYFTARDADHGRELWVLNRSAFTVSDSDGVALAKFYDDGSLALRGTLAVSASSITEGSTSSDFIIRASDDTIIALIDDSGDMTLLGTSTTGQSSITPDANTPEFILNDSDGTTAALIDEDGNMRILGTVVQNVTF